MNSFDAHSAQTKPTEKISAWEWLPPVAMVALALACLFAFKPDGGMYRLSLFVCLGLAPGTAWRLLGKSSWNVHRVCFAASLVAAVLDNPDLRPDRETFAKITENWWLVAAGFIAAFTQPFWGALRTQRLLADSGVAISKYDTFKIILAGSFFNIVLPGSTGGDAYRVYVVAKGYKGRLASVIASITLDRLLGLPSLILVVFLGMLLDYRFFRSTPFLTGLIPFISIAGAVCIALVAYLAFARGTGGKAIDGEEGRDSRQRGWIGRTHAMIASNVKRPATLPLALLYGFLAHLACIVSCLCFAVALDVEGVPPLRYFLIVPMAMTINAIPLSPGGVGQGEYAMAGLLEMASPGMSGNGVMIMLLFRIANMAIGLAGGLYYALGKAGNGGVDTASKRLAGIMAGKLPDDCERIARDSQRIISEGFRAPPALARTEGELNDTGAANGD